MVRWEKAAKPGITVTVKIYPKSSCPKLPLGGSTVLFENHWLSLIWGGRNTGKSSTMTTTPTLGVPPVLWNAWLTETALTNSKQIITLTVIPYHCASAKRDKCCCAAGTGRMTKAGPVRTVGKRRGHRW